jgi:predicted nucleic acid-binding protein
LFVPEVKTGSVKGWFAACSDPIVSADWILTEFASALSLKERRGEVTAQAARGLWEEFESFRGAGALDVGASSLATTDGVLDTNARKHGLATIGFGY